MINICRSDRIIVGKHTTNMLRFSLPLFPPSDMAFDKPRLMGIAGHAEGHLGASVGAWMPARREHMTNPTTDPAAYTDEELKQALARVIALARSEVLNDAEVEKFWQLDGEILRGRAPSGTAA